MNPPNPLIQLEVALGARTYPIYIGDGALDDASLWQGIRGRVLLVTNTTVGPLYAARLQSTLQRAGVVVETLELPDGEAHKDWLTLNQIFDHLLSRKFDRRTTLVALGGGVVGDMVGFAAAAYQRGIDFVQAPTTLLAQVDSSVGGKTAINHPLGKNMIGAFYQPRRVIIDTATLSTLPEREYLAGLAEVVKYGIALDRSFFDWLDDNLDALLARNTTAVAFAIQRSCEIKARVVAADERETAAEGGRALLNFGHTFGHAIEAALGFGVWLHGEAVGQGMLLATRYSARVGALDAASASRVQRLLARARLTQPLPAEATPELLLDHMGRDKKNEGGAIRLILLRGLGDAVVDGTHRADDILAFLRGA